MPRTIGARLLLASIASLVVSLAVLAVAAPLAARQHETDTTGTRLAGDAATVAELAREALARSDATGIDQLAKRIGAASGTRITIVARDGTVLGESDGDPRLMEDHANRPEVAAALEGRQGRAIRSSTTVGRDLLYVAVPVRSDGMIVGVARAALPLATLDALASSLAGAILAAALAGAVAAAIVAFLLERAITRPLVELTRRASTATETARFAVGGPEEVRRLGAALGSMAEAAREARRGVESERDRLATILAELSDAVLIVGADDHVRLANPAAERMLDARPLAGRRVVEVVRDHEIFEAIRQARQGRDAHAQIERDGPRRLVRVVARPLQDGQLLLSLQDLTTLQRLETVRRDFVANVSHELRTPIATLAAIAETLDAGAIDDPAAARDFVRRMQAEIGGLGQLVEELLSLARIESGAEPLRLAAIAPARLVEDAARRMAALADRAGVRLEVAPAEDVADVLADAEKVGQVLSNLVHNAVKFTPPGGRVTLATQARDTAIAISVRDTGTGIDPAALPRVFERFYKSDRSRATGGTGLGLAIAKHIVHAHGGDITAASDGPGRGATFTFTLPRA